MQYSSHLNVGSLINYSAGQWGCMIYSQPLVVATLKMNCRRWKRRTGSSNGWQPGLLERTFSTPLPPPPPPPPQQLWDREGLSSCSPRGEREDGNAVEMGVVLHGVETYRNASCKLVIWYPTKWPSIFSICHSRARMLMALTQVQADQRHGCVFII